MVTHHPEIPFERFADDILCHCGSESQAQALKSSLERRFAECGLELHPTKTKIVYCKDDDRRECRSQLRAIRAPATLDLSELGNDLPVATVEVIGDSGALSFQAQAALALLVGRNAVVSDELACVCQWLHSLLRTVHRTLDQM